MENNFNSMKLMRLTTHSEVYLRSLYEFHNDKDCMSYSNWYNLLMNDCYGWSDFWTYAFEKLGYEVWEPVGNAKPMQVQWAQEKKINFLPQTWFFDITKAQIQHFKPDILFVNDYVNYTPDFLEHIRESVPSVKLILGWCGGPFSDNRVFRAYDVVLSNIKSLVKWFGDQGHNSQLVHHAFDPRILDRLKDVPDNSQALIPLSFVGSIIKYKGFHREREELLLKLLEQVDLEIWGTTNRLTLSEHLKLACRKIIYDIVHYTSKIPRLNHLISKSSKLNFFLSLAEKPSTEQYLSPKLLPHVNPPVYGLQMYRTLRRSCITLNHHIDIAAQYASNMRLFESTGVGTCLLTDAQPDLHELFEPDCEVVTYSCVEEAVEKLRYLANHPENRVSIASAGQRRTLQEHTFIHRSELINKIIQQYVRL